MGTEGLSLLTKLGVGACSRLVGPKEDIRELVNCTERRRDSEMGKKETGVSAVWPDSSFLERLTRNKLSPDHPDSKTRSTASHLRPQEGLCEKCQLSQGHGLPGGQGKN